MISIKFILISIFVISVLINLVRGEYSYVNVGKIIKNYLSSFDTKWDCVCFILPIIPLSILLALEKQLDKDSLDVIGVILSILTSMVLSFMTLSNDKVQETISKKEIKSLDDSYIVKKNEVSLNVGMFEILISIIILILLFIFPLIKNEVFSNVLGGFIYFGFFVFLINVFLMVKRFFQIYSNAK